MFEPLNLRVQDRYRKRESNKRYLNTRLEQDSRARNIPESVSLRLRREEPSIRSCSEPVRQQFVARMLRTDRSRRTHARARARGTNSRARWRACVRERASLLSSRSLRDQFVEMEARHEKKQWQKKERKEGRGRERKKKRKREGGGEEDGVRTIATEKSRT